jgi:8-oxo-dGTP pyrophosphatase MutT (NUDIX family)
MTFIAATVVVLRDGPSGLEALLVRRTRQLSFAAGHWVFPGGRVEDRDHDRETDDELAAARNAAARETMEESGIELDPDLLTWFAHWTPPATAPRRYATYFFAAAAPSPDQDVVVDGSEADAWSWVSPRDAIEARERGAVELRPATWITLYHLCRFPRTAEALDVLGCDPVEYFETRLATTGDERTALYRGDAGYDTFDATAQGPRHRLVMGDGRWRYERDERDLPIP